MFRVFGRYTPAATALLAIAEALVVCAIIYASAAIFSGNLLDLGPDLALGLGFIAIAVVLVMQSMGLYDESAFTNLRQSLIKLAFIVAPIFMLAVITTGILARNNLVQIYPYRWQWTIGLTSLWFASVLGERLLFAHLHNQGKFTRRVALVGSPQLSSHMGELLHERPNSIRVVAQLDLSQFAKTEQQKGAPSELLLAIKATGAHEVVVDPTILCGDPVTDLVASRTAGFSVTRFDEFFEREAGRVDLTSIAPRALLFSKGLEYGLTFNIVKRAMDILFAIIGLILFLPVISAAALALRLEGSGPLLYRQERVGRYGKPFSILKFRSMRQDAEKDGTPSWASEGDPRITPVGRIIRKLRVDELPQFINVLRGDMSMVGPRPERPFFVSKLGESLPFYNERHLVQPGITGWAQVNFHYGASFEDAMRKHSYDLYYLKHRSIWLDFIILLKTVHIVLFAEGAR